MSGVGNGFKPPTSLREPQAASHLYNRWVHDGFYASDFPKEGEEYEPLSERDKRYAESIIADPQLRAQADAKR